MNQSTKPDFNPSDIIDIASVHGIGDYSEAPDGNRFIYKKPSAAPTVATDDSSTGKAFAVINKHTLEVRTDPELRKLLTSKYESVMESRYFGRGGIEIVLAGNQFSQDELSDLVRLSYNLTD